jgi:hypothetical protein
VLLSMRARQYDSIGAVVLINASHNTPLIRMDGQCIEAERVASNASSHSRVGCVRHVSV